ncbi:MAG TPA: hypothetical protein PK987_08340 [Ferruginibacter sp.]|nr:hypothetical protein [Ferruginibacter sp.]
MHLSLSDWIGFIGVAILLIAFLMNLLNKIDKNSLVYILMNVIGAGMACLASWMINYIPFIILEATWTVVSLFALVGYFRKK